VFRTHEIRLDRVPSIPRGQRCPHDQYMSPAAACRFTAASPCHPGLRPAPGCVFHEASAKVHCRSPQPAFPSPVAPGRNGDPRAFPRASCPAGHDPAAHARAGTDHGHRPDYVPGISQPPSTYSLTTCDNASQHVQYVPDSRFAVTFAQASALSPTACKAARNLVVPAACPIGCGLAATHGHSRSDEPKCRRLACPQVGRGS
jgi:hypothetical protein